MHFHIYTNTYALNSRKCKWKLQYLSRLICSFNFTGLLRQYACCEFRSELAFSISGEKRHTNTHTQPYARTQKMLGASVAACILCIQYTVSTTCFGLFAISSITFHSQSVPQFGVFAYLKELERNGAWFSNCHFVLTRRTTPAQIAELMPF